MKIWTAVLIGFLLGALSITLFHPPTKAHANGTLRLHVMEVPKGNSFEALGSQVVGFSCIDSPGQSRCFVASSD